MRGFHQCSCSQGSNRAASAATRLTVLLLAFLSCKAKLIIFGDSLADGGVTGIVAAEELVNNHFSTSPVSVLLGRELYSTLTVALLLQSALCSLLSRKGRALTAVLALICAGLLVDQRRRLSQCSILLWQILKRRNMDRRCVNSIGAGDRQLCGKNPLAEPCNITQRSIPKACVQAHCADCACSSLKLFACLICKCCCETQN